MDPSTASSLCLGPLAAGLQNGRVTIDQYFENLLAHVTTKGLTHEDDRASPRSRAALTSLTTSDAVCGAIRIWMLNPAYPKLKAVDVDPVKQILIAAWDGRDSSLENITLSPQIIQVLVAIAFHHQRTESLAHTLTLVKNPPEETIFDLMNLNDLSSANKSPSIWDRVLRSGWIHPVPTSASPRERSSRAAGWMSMVERSLTTTDSAESSPSQLASFLRALRDNNIMPTMSLLSGLVEKGAVTADRMALFCAIFPLRRLKNSSEAQNSSPNALLCAATLSPLSQGEKCALLEVLLQQGLDLNWVPKAYVPTGHADFRTDVDGWYQRRDETETALHVAVEKGEVDVVRLLLRNKARTDIKDGRGRVALDRLSAGSGSEKEVCDALKAAGKRPWFKIG